MRKLLVLLAALLFAGYVHAENATRAGGYTIHHNALTTDSLSPEVARAYDIPRSTSRGMLNITVVRDEPGTSGTPVTAQIKINARNLIGQERSDINLREVREGKAIYYIADFPVSNREQLTFDLDVLPAGETHALHARFNQEFFTD
jgi:hypothetical protein